MARKASSSWRRESSSCALRRSSSKASHIRTSVTSRLRCSIASARCEHLLCQPECRRVSCTTSSAASRQRRQRLVTSFSGAARWAASWPKIRHDSRPTSRATSSPSPAIHLATAIVETEPTRAKLSSTSASSTALDPAERRCIPATTSSVPPLRASPRRRRSSAAGADPGAVFAAIPGVEGARPRTDIPSHIGAGPSTLSPPPRLDRRRRRARLVGRDRKRQFSIMCGPRATRRRVRYVCATRPPAVGLIERRTL